MDQFCWGRVAWDSLQESSWHAGLLSSCLLCLGTPAHSVQRCDAGHLRSPGLRGRAGQESLLDFQGPRGGEDKQGAASAGIWSQETPHPQLSPLRLMPFEVWLSNLGN